MNSEFAGHDVVHVNAEFIDQASDHDPQLVQLTMPAPTISASSGAGRERGRVEQHRGDRELHLRRPVVGNRGRLSGAGGALGRRVRTSRSRARRHRRRALALGQSHEHRHRPDQPDGHVYGREGDLSGSRRRSRSLVQPATPCRASRRSTCANIDGPATSFGWAHTRSPLRRSTRPARAARARSAFTVVVTYSGLCTLDAVVRGRSVRGGLALLEARGNGGCGCCRKHQDKTASSPRT